jgi:hypothetical protein
MPSTGILCTALLKQIQYPSQVDESARIPPSEVVQNLSLLIGFLEWIRPSAGNYKLCQRMAKVLRRVLDQIFDPKPEAPPAQSQELTGWPVEGPWQMDGMSDWDWLNSIDWTGSHMEIIQ